METNGDYQKLIKALLSQKSYYEVKNGVEKGEEVDDSVFNQADYNGDGRVDETDKNLFEEYIKNYEELFGEVDIDYSKLEDLAQQGEEENQNGEDGNTAKLNELKEQCLQVQAQMQEAKTKYDNAVKKSESAKEKQESLEAKSASASARFETEKQRYNEILMKKMKANSSSDNKGKNAYEDQLSDARKSRDSAQRSASLAQGEYGLACANKAYYDSQVSSNKAEYDKLTESFNTLSSEFTSIYDSLSAEEKSKFGENPFINSDNSN